MAIFQLMRSISILPLLLVTCQVATFAGQITYTLSGTIHKRPGVAGDPWEIGRECPSVS